MVSTESTHLLPDNSLEAFNGFFCTRKPIKFRWKHFTYGMLTLLANDCMYVKYLKLVANSVTDEFNGGKYVVTVCFIAADAVACISKIIHPENFGYF